MHVRPGPLAVAAAAVLPLSALRKAGACSRAVYFGKECQTVTGRTMDWMEDIKPNLSLLPRGLQESSNTRTPFTWKSAYGSVIQMHAGPERRPAPHPRRHRRQTKRATVIEPASDHYQSPFGPPRPRPSP